MISKTLNFLLILFYFAISLEAQNTKPCTTDEGRQFDFWIGEWDASWEGGKGVNNVSKILDGCVIFEEFDASFSSKLVGKSVSVYNPRAGNWQQTWVDNSGGYLDFIGKWEEDKMILSRSVDIKGVITMQRMIWYNISQDKFDWNWEKSTDNGKTWTVSWKINYTRRKS